MLRLPEKTIERLSEYRRTLLNLQAEGKTHIYSHELARLHNITAVQVRRDIMFIGYSSLQRKGYDIRELIDVIGKILDTDQGLNVAVVGIGNLGMAVTAYFFGKRPRLNIVAAFDNNPAKVDRVISGVKCYSMAQLPDVIKDKDISIALITVPPDAANQVAEQLVLGGIKGILNFTSVPINVGPEVYLEEYDMITSVEKVAYFVKKQNEVLSGKG
jgi:redox-sensing transcriptional repressor